MLTTHIKREYFWYFLSFANFYLFLVMQIFMDFLILQIFMGFMQGYESSKDKWYKSPLVGVLPQALQAHYGWSGLKAVQRQYAVHSSYRCNCNCSISWILSPVWRCHAWDVSMCWCSISWVLSFCTRSSPCCWVMAPNPQDEAIRLARLGALLELELVDQ